MADVAAAVDDDGDDDDDDDDDDGGNGDDDDDDDDDDAESNITALLCDPAHRPNREKFREMCDKLGLAAIVADFPGDPQMRLVQVLRR